MNFSLCLFSQARKGAWKLNSKPWSRFCDRKFDCVRVLDLRLSPILQIMSNIKLQSKLIFWGGRCIADVSCNSSFTRLHLLYRLRTDKLKQIYSGTKQCQVCSHLTFYTTTNLYLCTGYISLWIMTCFISIKTWKKKKGEKEDCSNKSK